MAVRFKSLYRLLAHAVTANMPQASCSVFLGPDGSKL